jgi:hypothetical protein
VTARGYQPIRAQITIRFNKIPTVGLPVTRRDDHAR